MQFWELIRCYSVRGYSGEFGASYSVRGYSGEFGAIYSVQGYSGESGASYSVRGYLVQELFRENGLFCLDALDMDADNLGQRHKNLGTAVLAPSGSNQIVTASSNRI